MEYMTEYLIPELKKADNPITDKVAFQKLQEICGQFGLLCFCPTLKSFQMRVQQRVQFIQVVRGRRGVLTESLSQQYDDDWWEFGEESLLHYAQRSAAGKVSVSPQQSRAGESSNLCSSRFLFLPFMFSNLSLLSRFTTTQRSCKRQKEKSTQHREDSKAREHGQGTGRKD
jgi:hypothetical protein